MRTRHLILGLCGLVALGGLGWLIHLIADPSSAREDVAVGPELPVPEADPGPPPPPPPRRRPGGGGGARRGARAARGRKLERIALSRRWTDGGISSAR